jgi:hypothetical protein
MCKSGIRNYLERIEATYRARFLEHTNTRTQPVTRVTYVSSEHPSEVNKSHNPTTHSRENTPGNAAEKFPDPQDLNIRSKEDDLVWQRDQLRGLRFADQRK